ncbi:MAG: hypothetical protein ACPG52_06425 [Cognaticolwellia sp.]
MRFLGVLLNLLILVGCANTSVNTKKSNFSYENPIKFRNTLYGLLEKNDDGYAITRFSYDIPSSDSTPWVNLKTGQPNWNTEQQITFNKLLEKTSYTTRNKTEKLFFDYSIDKGHLAFLGVVTFGTAPLYIDNKYNITFNQKKMNEALQQAINKISMEDRNNLLILDETYSALKSYREETQNLYNFKSEKLKTDMSIKVNDESGFYKGEIDFKKLIEFKLNELHEIPHIATGSINGLVNRFTLKLIELKSSWDLASQTINQKCSYTSAMNFLLEFNCPEVINTNSKTLEFDTVVIKSKNFKNIIVKNFNHQDTNIIQSFDGNKINISNISKEFITLQNIAFYYNDKVAILNDLNIEMAPESSFTKDNYIEINDFRIDWEEMKYANLTMGAAEKINTNFGFAVKYSIQSDSAEHTLYSKKSYKLVDIL